MPIAADLRIECSWIAPMAERGGILHDHSLLIGDGRILDILPTAAARRSSAAQVIHRPAHLLLPGFVDANFDAAESLRAASGPRHAAADGVPTKLAQLGMLKGIAAMLRAGSTCFAERRAVRSSAAVAVEQGVRAVIGMPIDAAPQSVTDALALRDEYRGHPLVSTVFAPRQCNALPDSTLERLGVLADELDATILVDLHRSAAEIAGCQALHGLSPIERLSELGLLTPALSAMHMTRANGADIELAQRAGLSIGVCPTADLNAGEGLPPVAAFAAARLPCGLGSGGAGKLGHDVWSDLRLTAALLKSPWDALALATRGGAQLLGLDAQTGTLAAGKWADLCCLDLSGPSVHPAHELFAQVVFCGGREMVSDVWIAGRQLLAAGALTRLDWPEVAAEIDGCVAAARGEG